jgi:hypothetical protein
VVGLCLTPKVLGYKWNSSNGNRSVFGTLSSGFDSVTIACSMLVIHSLVTLGPRNSFSGLESNLANHLSRSNAIGVFEPIRMYPPSSCNTWGNAMENAEMVAGEGAQVHMNPPGFKRRPQSLKNSME